MADHRSLGVGHPNLRLLPFIAIDRVGYNLSIELCIVTALSFTLTGTFKVVFAVLSS